MISSEPLSQSSWAAFATLLALSFQPDYYDIADDDADEKSCHLNLHPNPRFRAVFAVLLPQSIHNLL